MHNFRPSILDGRGAVHIDYIAADCIRKRQDAATMSLRLEVASMLASVLDRA